MAKRKKDDPVFIGTQMAIGLYRLELMPHPDSEAHPDQKVFVLRRYGFSYDPTTTPTTQSLITGLQGGHDLKLVKWRLIQFGKRPVMFLRQPKHNIEMWFKYFMLGKVALVKGREVFFRLDDPRVALVINPDEVVNPESGEVFRPGVEAVALGWRAQVLT
jgi:hypothetical protein